MVAVVTGSCGFIGSNLVRTLAHEGITVVGVDISEPDTNKNEGLSIEWQGDVRDPEFMRWIMHEYDPDVVYHLAAQSSVPISVKAPRSDADTNIIGTITLLDAMKDAGVQKLVYAASGGTAYGKSPEVPTPESDDSSWPAVDTPYALSKRVAHEYIRQSGISATSLFLSNVYGTGQDPHGESGVVAIFLEKMLNEEPCTIYGTGEQTRDFIYIDDAVEAFILGGRNEGTFNIGTGRETSVLEIFELLGSEVHARTGWAPYAVHEPARDEVQRSALISDKADKNLWWYPTVRIDEGIRRYVAKSSSV